jgi:hypothetical protein
MVKRLVLIPHQRNFHREKWVWMRAGMGGSPLRLASNRSNTDRNLSNFTGECCVAICGIDSQCVKIGLTYQLYSFSIRPSLVWKERIGLAEWYYPRSNHDDAMVGTQTTRRVVWSGREDLNLRHPAPKAGALPGCATPRLSTSCSLTVFGTPRHECSLLHQQCRCS